MGEIVPISKAKNMRSGINVDAKVKSKGESRTVNLKRGGTINVCDAVISDGEGQDNEMKLTLWGEEIEKVKQGDRVVITDGYANEFRGEVSLTKGKFGKMEVNP